MWNKYLNFIRGVGVNWYGKIGVVLTTSSFFTFLLLEIARIGGSLTNQYIGLITYLLLPTLFVVGLILIPIGWYKYKATRDKSTWELLNEQFPQEDVEARRTGSRLFLTVGILTGLNVLFLALASMQTLHFMDKPVFCGTACHSVMNPEWTTYQDSPHARVKCVECHVGEGIDALIDSKLNGAWQMVSATFNLYEKPIPTPVHQLRPARETCEKCHWPSKFYGSRLQTDITYRPDSASTPLYTTLNLKIDGGPEATYAGIHWHIAEENTVRYTSIDDERETIIDVEVKQPDGSFKTYRNTRLSVDDYAHEDTANVRAMDCIDCHNRATHIYENPENAVNERIRLGKIPRSLPYIKREALAALTNNYNDTTAAKQGIATRLRGFYRRNYPNISRSKSAEIDTAISVLQETWLRNIHPEMNIIWGSYPSHIGHPSDDAGCFRCHNSYMRSESGDAIDNDCTLCHSILANQSREPFEYLNTITDEEPESALKKYLQQEFLNYFYE
ncbi:MAG: NapC/NirT family cytochrome c [Candidatus Marinimicrobia bacterium]|nr:NapC/NirT family cytochrome c [Candidatus Neomarinimicrobiota bacterium]MCF7828661.1 NapC/NirT family cytochrome c [Candidatus Neomarinimicrobiota bacterium]MCF7880402.1 NapC/NirT family cytochrome c [Candidatus Neomarinimicrobiota bacterium]